VSDVLTENEVSLEELLGEPLTCSIHIWAGATKDQGWEVCGEPAIGILTCVCTNGHSDQDRICGICKEDLARDYTLFTCDCDANYATYSLRML
jgi:hypothetical protein